jgi:transposase-like protein
MPKTYSAAPDLASLLDGSSAGELIPELARHGLQQLIELEVAAFLGADRHERTDERLGYRNGYRSRTLTTQVGDLALQIPKLRSGSFIPSILEPRRRIDQALYAVIMEAYIPPLPAKLSAHSDRSTRGPKHDRCHRLTTPNCELRSVSG